MIPVTPTITTQTSEYPNFAPACALNTRSPMSTKPPIADRIPSVICRRRFTTSTTQSARMRR